MADKVDVKKIIKDLSDLNWEESDESQMKAVQLLKGIALSKDPLSNIYMKELSKSSTLIAKALLGAEEMKEAKKDPIAHSNLILEGIDDVEVKSQKKQNMSSVASKAASLL